MKEISMENRLEEAKLQLSSRRGTGRTTKMLKEVLEQALSNGEPGDYFVVLAHTPEWAKDMNRMMLQMLHDLHYFTNQRPGGIEVKTGVNILFHTEDWWNRNKSMIGRSVKEVFYDNVFDDLDLEKYIRFLEGELNPLPPRKVVNSVKWSFNG